MGLLSLIKHNQDNLGPITEGHGDIIEVNSLISVCTDESSAKKGMDMCLSMWLTAQAELLGGNRSPEQLRYSLRQGFVLLSKAINRQLDEVLHHPRFQQLEASWRGLQYLASVEASYDESLSVKIKVFNASWLEVGKDLTRAIEFDQSQLFQHIYSKEFDTPGGEPYGVLLGDYKISHRARPDVPFSDIEVMQHISDVATAALCPYISSISPSLFGLDSLRELVQPLDFDQIFKQQEYYAWNKLRRYEGSRFVGLMVGDVLVREPYADDNTRREDFFYQERVDDPDKDMLWGNACYAFGSVLVRAFANTGWFADIRGGTHKFGEGGVVRQLRYASNRFEQNDLSSTAATNIMIDDFLERELSELGFIPLCSYHSVEKSVFYSNNSLHEPKKYKTSIATANAKLSSMIQYMMCVSRFGHFVKMLGRNKVGSFIGPEECQRVFQNWLNQYVTSGEANSSELKARYPLSMGKVDIKEKPGNPGYYSCVMHLQPHFQLDQLVSSIQLVTELAVGAVTPKTPE